MNKLQQSRAHSSRGNRFIFDPFLTPAREQRRNLFPSAKYSNNIVLYESKDQDQDDRRKKVGKPVGAIWSSQGGVVPGVDDSNSVQVTSINRNRDLYLSEEVEKDADRSGELHISSPTLRLFRDLVRLNGQEVPECDSELLASEISSIVLELIDVVAQGRITMKIRTPYVLAKGDRIFDPFARSLFSQFPRISIHDAPRFLKSLLADLDYCMPFSDMWEVSREGETLFLYPKHSRREVLDASVPNKAAHFIKGTFVF